MDIKITPSPLKGTLKAISSKSDAHRRLICAALADRTTRLYVPQRSVDINTTVRCLNALGANISYSQGIYTVHPIPASGGRSDVLLDCYESGSTLRFLMPVAASVADHVSFVGRGKLPRRPIADLLMSMESNGVRFSNHSLPLVMEGRLQSGRFELPGNVSSQYVSGLLMAFPTLPKGGSLKLTTALESSAYVDMTISSMRVFGVKVKKTQENGYEVEADQRYLSPGQTSTEGDWSSAAFFLTAGAIGGEITMTGLCQESYQCDKEILPILQHFGAEVTPQQKNNHGDHRSGEGPALTVRKAPLTSRNLDIRNIPDLLPILSVLAASSKGTTRFTGGQRLRYKESNRLAATVSVLRSMGGLAWETPDGLIVTGSPLSGGIVDGYNDHRIVMSAAIAAAFAQDSTVILGADAVNKSYPSFFEDFVKLGGKVDVL